MKFISNLFFTDIGFCKLKVIQGLDLNFNLYLLILLRGAYVANNILILSKFILTELSAVSSSVFNKIFLIKFGPVHLINIRFIA